MDKESVKGKEEEKKGEENKKLDDQARIKVEEGGKEQGRRENIHFLNWHWTKNLRWLIQEFCVEWRKKRKRKKWEEEI